MVIVIAGPPCAGKSRWPKRSHGGLEYHTFRWIARGSVSSLAAQHTRADRKVAYRAMTMAAELLHAAGAKVILDAPYGHPEDRDRLETLGPLWVECRVSPDIAVQRRRQRGFDPQRPDLTDEIVRESAAQWVYQGLVLDTESLSVEDCVRAAEHAISLHPAESPSTAAPHAPSNRS